MGKKSILLLGGSRQQVVAIEKAKELGYRTVLCDYLPDNPGQHYADVFYQESTTDRDKMLDIARMEHVDGVLAYSSDPAAPTAAYVAEQLGLPTNPLWAVETMSVKDRFRAHMAACGLPCPKAVGFPASISAEKLKEALEGFSFPLVVKPTDSSGSKGVTVVDSVAEMRGAIEYANSFGRNGNVIAEEFIERTYPNVVGGDVFVVDGKVVFWGLMDCIRENESALVPVGEIGPSGLSDVQRKKTEQVIQSLVTSLDLRFGELNVEVMIGAENTPYVIELGSRAGGNMIPVQLSDASGVDLVQANVLCAMGENPGDLSWGASISPHATYVMHSMSPGTLERIEFSQFIAKNIYRTVMYKSEGDAVEPFDGANKAVGIVFLKFEDANLARQFGSKARDHIKVVVA